MMKIVAGILGGRSIIQPKSRTVRPLSEKVRAAVFDVTGPLNGLSVLDAYAGSGAAGFEALSRGALLVEAIEYNPVVAKVIESNAKNLNLGERHVLYRTKVQAWLDWPANHPPKSRYDLIIADPPYRELEPAVIARLGEFLKAGGLLVLSHTARLEPPRLTGLELIKHKSYGDSTLSFYRKEN